MTMSVMVSTRPARLTFGFTGTQVTAYTEAGTFRTVIVRKDDDRAYRRNIAAARAFAYRTPAAPRTLAPQDDQRYWEAQESRFEAHGWEVAS